MNDQEKARKIAERQFKDADAKKPISNPVAWMRKVEQNLLNEEYERNGTLDLLLARGGASQRRTLQDPNESALAIAAQMAKQGCFTAAEIYHVLCEDHEPHVASKAMGVIQSGKYQTVGTQGEQLGFANHAGSRRFGAFTAPVEGVEMEGAEKGLQRPYVARGLTHVEPPVLSQMSLDSVAESATVAVPTPPPPVSGPWDE